MARPLRLEFPGAIYHITSRGNARADVFLDDVDRKMFLAVLADTVERYNWVCHAYCLMDNHYHLLIETPEPNLSLGMRQLNGVYTQSFNRRHGRVGHVFQGRYKSILVEKGSYLLELCRYIVLNPVKAGMVKRPGQWQWSSYPATAGTGKAAVFLTTDWLLSQFARTRSAARKRYAAFVREGLRPEPDGPWQRLQGQIFFGGSQFIARMRERLGEQKEIGEIPRKQRYPGRPALEDIFAGMDTRKDRGRKIRTAHLDYGYTLREIAEVLGVHYTTVSRAVRREG